MVAYGFKKQFVEYIESGRKPHTMRNERKRHARPGEEMQLYYAMRTKHCRLLGRPTCLHVLPARIDFRPGTVQIEGRAIIQGRHQLDQFAFSDGFADFAALKAFWDKEHDKPDAWSGFIIEWDTKTLVRPA